MSAPLRILQICHKPPRPAVDGGCIAMDSLTTGLLAEGHRVKVLTLHTQKHPFRQNQIDHTYLEATGLEAIFADTELNLRDALSHVITGESYHLSRFHVPEMDRAIEEALRVDMYDVVLLESLFTTSYIPAIRRLSDAEIVLRAHNVEHKLWEDVSQGMGPGPKKWLLNLFQSKLASEERRLLHAVDAVAAITEHDATWFRNHLPLLHRRVAGDCLALWPGRREPTTLRNEHPSPCRASSWRHGLDAQRSGRAVAEGRRVAEGSSKVTGASAAARGATHACGLDLR